jgi:hypothetical protein
MFFEIVELVVLAPIAQVTHVRFSTISFSFFNDFGDHNVCFLFVLFAELLVCPSWLSSIYRNLSFFAHGLYYMFNKHLCASLYSNLTVTVTKMFAKLFYADR